MSTVLGILSRSVTSRSDLELALRIHRSLVPEPFEDDRYAFACAYDPVETVGGDYGYAGYEQGGRLVLHVSDVTGHGVPAALMVGRVCGLVRGLSRPREVLEELNRFLAARFPETGMLMSFCALRIDPARKRLTWSGAGHPPALVVPPRGPARRLESQNPILGVGPMRVREGACPVERGALVVAFTDGVFEDLDGLVRRLEADRRKPVGGIVEAVRKLRRRADDALVLAVRVK